MQAHDAAGRSVLPKTRKTRAVLALLALASPQPVLRRQLISLLWSRREHRQASGSLRQALHELQSSLQPQAVALLTIDRLHVALRNDALQVDIGRTPRSGAAGSAAPAPRLLDDMDGLDPAFDAWLVKERRVANQRMRVQVEALLHDAVGPEQRIAAAERLLSIDRGHEGAWQALIRARLDQGDRLAAVAVFDECREALAAAAQLAPSAATEQLLAEARSLDQSASVAPEPGCPTLLSSEWLGRLRVGVMPFRPHTGDVPGMIAAGLAEEIVLALSRFNWLSCVPVSPLASFLGTGTSDVLMAGRLRLDFLLDGAVLQNGPRLRVILHLLDLRSAGDVVWSARFDRDCADVLDLQEDIAAGAVAQLEPKLLMWEGQRATALHSANPRARDLLHMAIPALFRLDRSRFQQAGEYLDRALRLSPDNPDVHVWLAQWHLFALGQGWAGNISAARQAAQQFAGEAIGRAPDDARALTLAGHVRGFVEGRIEEALRLHEHAISANPNLPFAWSRAALAHSFAGQHTQALYRAGRARHLSPEGPLGFLHETSLAFSHLLLGEYDKSALHAERAIEQNGEYSSSYKIQLAALGHLGRRESAEKTRGRLLMLEPGFSVSQAIERSPIRVPEDRDRYAEGLRRGGLA